MYKMICEKFNDLGLILTPNLYHFWIDDDQLF